VSFAAPRSSNDCSAMLLSDRRGVVRRLVIKDEYIGAIQLAAEVRHNLADGLLFIEARDQNRNVAVARFVCVAVTSWLTSAHIRDSGFSLHRPNASLREDRQTAWWRPERPHSRRAWPRDSIDHLLRGWQTGRSSARTT